MDAIHLGKIDSDAGVTVSRKDKVDGSFKKWEKFAAEANIDTYLRNFDEFQKFEVFSGFAYRIRHNFAGTTSRDELRGSTVRADVFNVSQAFQQNGYDDPIRTRDGRLSRLLSRQFKAYIELDPPPNQQSPLPISIFRDIKDLAITARQKAEAQLIRGSLFFGHRSCEYTKTPKNEEKKTRLLELQDIRFYDSRKKEVKHAHIKARASELEFVAIRYRNQKNGEVNEVVVQRRNHKDLCPVIEWRDLAIRIWSYPGTHARTTVNTFFDTKKQRFYDIESKHVLAHLRRVVQHRGAKLLGIPIKSVGTHSVRISFAMLMHLNGSNDSKIMKMGRWKSAAFLAYIRSYVDQFGGDSSIIIVKDNGDFITLRK